MAEDESADLLKTVMDQAGELIAIDILLKALIASHPNPVELKRALEMLSANFGVQIRDYAFDTNRGPKLAGSAATSIQKHIDRWLEILEAGTKPK